MPTVKQPAQIFAETSSAKHSVQMPKLDLHGITEDQAWELLSAYLPSAAKAGVKELLIITGKGAEGKGVLRQIVPRWLKESALKTHVREVTPATKQQGGTGALVVVLRS